MVDWPAAETHDYLVVESTTRRVVGYARAATFVSRYRSRWRRRRVERSEAEIRMLIVTPDGWERDVQYAWESADDLDGFEIVHFWPTEVITWQLVSRRSAGVELLGGVWPGEDDWVA